MNLHTELVLMDIDKIIPYEKNVKKHPEEHIAKLASNMKQFGFDQPIVVDKDMVIIKGHGRRLAALSLGLKKIPVLIKTDISKEQADAERISDNKVVSNDYDFDMMKEEMNRLVNDAGIDFISLGFDEKEMQYLVDSIESEVNLTGFVDDMTNALESKDKKNEEFDDELDNRDVSLTRVLKFSKIKGEYEFDIEQFMNKAEAFSKKEGSEAFCEYVRHLILDVKIS